MFDKKLLPTVLHRSAVLINNAPYYSRRKDKILTTAWQKEDIKRWHTKVNVPLDYMKKKE